MSPAHTRALGTAAPLGRPAEAGRVLSRCGSSAPRPGCPPSSEALRCCEPAGEEEEAAPRRAGPAPLSRLAALWTPQRVVPGSPAAAGWEVHHGLGALPEAASSQPACGAGRALGSPNRPPPPAPARPFSPRRGGGNRGTCCAAPAR